MSIIRLSVLACGVALVSACSSGSTAADRAAIVFNETELQGLLESHTEVFGEDIVAGRFFDPANFATEGTASYAGAIGILESSGRDISVPITDAIYASSIIFDVDLGSGDVTGRAENFVEISTEERITGLLTVNGSLNRLSPTGFGAVGRLDGSLDLSGGRRAELDGEFRGDFFGETADAFDADAEGNFDVFDSEGNFTEADSFVYDADIISERFD